MTTVWPRWRSGAVGSRPSLTRSARPVLQFAVKLLLDEKLVTPALDDRQLVLDVDHGWVTNAFSLLRRLVTLARARPRKTTASGSRETMEMVAQAEAAARPGAQRTGRRSPSALTALLVGVAAFGTARDSDQSIARQTVVEPLAVKLPDPIAAPRPDLLARSPVRARRHVRRLPHRLGVDGADTTALLKQNAGSKPFRNLRPGTTVHARTSDLGQLLDLRFVAGDAIRARLRARRRALHARSTRPPS